MCFGAVHRECLVLLWCHRADLLLSHNSPGIINCANTIPIQQGSFTSAGLQNNDIICVCSLQKAFFFAGDVGQKTLLVVGCSTPPLNLLYPVYFFRGTVPVTTQHAIIFLCGLQITKPHGLQNCNQNNLQWKGFLWDNVHRCCLASTIAVFIEEKNAEVCGRI